jgi:hypothetical protein
MEVAFPNLFMYLFSRLSEEDVQMVAVASRLLWLRRNAVVHGGDLSSPTQIVETALSQLENFRKAERGRQMTRHTALTATHMTWSKPQEGFIKLNWDAAIDIQQQRMGIGIIARDHT